MDRVKLGDVCARLSSGDSIKAANIHDSGSYPVFGANGIRGYTSTYNFGGECAVIGRQGEKCGNVGYSNGKAFMSEHAIVAQPCEGYDAKYLSYLLSLMNLRRLSGQSAQPGLAVETLREVPLYFPNYEKQRSVSVLLHSLDDKIASNKKLMGKLEATARLIYDYWFTQFDFPDENGKPYRSSGGKMVYNSTLKREIPATWQEGTLEDLIFLERDSILPMADVLYEHYSIPAFDEDGCPSFDEGSEIDSNKYSITDGAMLYSKLNPKFKRLWSPLFLSSNPICSTEFLVLYSRDRHLRPFCYSVLDSAEFYLHMVQRAVSSTGSRSRVDTNAALSFCIALPPETIARSFSGIVQPFWVKVTELQRENRELVELRDWLLPMLMNGQVSVERSNA